MFHRYNVTINFPASHPMNSLSAMRLLAATPDSNTSNIRRELSHALFSSYWIENKGTVSKIPKVAPAPRE
jgi:2-hydroxychromene-2-carboxylate isomerase